MHDILAQSDIVVLTLPLTKETYHMFDQELFDGMREDSILVNVARGALIEENALKQALDTGKFRAVILDVFEKEPLNENFWGWKAERVRIIPHNTFESKDENGNDLPKTIISREYSSEWKPGDEPYYPVNDAKNSALYAEYKKLADAEDSVIFGGRLGEYKYYDMDQVIAAVLDKCEKKL